MNDSWFSCVLLFIKSLTYLPWSTVFHAAALCWLCCLTDVSGGSSLHKILRKRDGKIFTQHVIIPLIQSSTPVKGVLKMPSRSFALLCFHPVAGAGTASSKASVAIDSSKAQEFLAKLSRTKRNLWDRSRPDVQQWIMQFMYMGYDEQVGCVCPRRVQVFFFQTQQKQKSVSSGAVNTTKLTHSLLPRTHV